MGDALLGSALLNSLSVEWRGVTMWASDLGRWGHPTHYAILAGKGSAYGLHDCLS